MNIRFDKILFLSLFCLGSIQAFPQNFKSYYLSPNGNDSYTGQSIQEAFASIKKGLEVAEAGDTLFLLPGNYPAKNLIEDKHGLPDLPIILRSYADDPLEYAVIDAASQASTEDGQEAFVLQNSSWIQIEKLVFRNCWASVILIKDSEYISIRSCHFSTGKRIVHAKGHGTHHILVENSYVQHPEEVWKGWSWESLHHGTLSYYNGALLHPNKSAGGHIMRRNTLINVYNGFRTRPNQLIEDGNTEVYGNRMINIRDNEYEPEGWAWNMHYYHNEHVNIHKMYSIDGVKGGNIYIYGNTYTQSKDPWAVEEVSGIFKYKSYEDGPLSFPCYAFNNSYYTEAEVLRRGESTNHSLKHFNNAYFFFEGKKRFHLTEWQPGYEFDYDCINQDWPPNIYAHAQEKQGLKFTDAKFRNGPEGDLRLQPQSPCIDAGTPLALPEFNWTQDYEGQAPDIGAFEGEKLVDGPPFRFIPAEGFDLYKEHPRISKHQIQDKLLILFFTAPIDQQSLSANSIELYQKGTQLEIDSLYFPRDHFELHIRVKESLKEEDCSVLIKSLRGENGLAALNWGSTIPIGKIVPNSPDLSQIPVKRIREFEVPDYRDAQMKIQIPAQNDSVEIKIMSKQKLQAEFVDRLAIYSEDGDDLGGFYPSEIHDDYVLYKPGVLKLAPGKYQARIRLGKEVLVKDFEID